jgi:hypothetical protein
MAINDKPESMSCSEFQDQLGEMIASGKDADNHPHARMCENCRSLLQDLKDIAEASRWNRGESR